MFNKHPRALTQPGHYGMYCSLNFIHCQVHTAKILGQFKITREGERERDNPYHYKIVQASAYIAQYSSAQTRYEDRHNSYHYRTIQ